MTLDVGLLNCFLSFISIIVIPLSVSSFIFTVLSISLLFSLFFEFNLVVPLLLLLPLSLLLLLQIFSLWISARDTIFDVTVDIDVDSVCNVLDFSANNALWCNEFLKKFESMLPKSLLSQFQEKKLLLLLLPLFFVLSLVRFESKLKLSPSSKVKLNLSQESKKYLIRNLFVSKFFLKGCLKTINYIANRRRVRGFSHGV